jgi:hypothetical protein
MIPPILFVDDKVDGDSNEYRYKKLERILSSHGFVAWPPPLKEKAPEWRTLRSPNLQSCRLTARCYAKNTLFYPS